MKRRRYEAAGGVVFDGDFVLVLHRPGRGEVRLPKGHIEPGEAASDTALRETCEETGYAAIEIVAPLGEMTVRFEWEGARIERRETYFLMRLVGGATRPRPAKDASQFRVRWRPPAQALAELTFEAEREWVERAVRVRQERSTGEERPG